MNEETFQLLRENGLCPYEIIALERLIEKLKLNLNDVIVLVQNGRTS